MIQKNFNPFSYHWKKRFMILLLILYGNWKSINPNQGGLFGQSIRWGVGDQSGTFLFIILIHCQISYKSNKNGLIWKLASLFTLKIIENHPFFRSFFVRLPWGPLVLQRNFLVFRSTIIWKIWIFDLHAQYAYQMKAKNILDSNLNKKVKLYKDIFS